MENISVTQEKNTIGLNITNYEINNLNITISSIYFTLNAIEENGRSIKIVYKECENQLHILKCSNFQIQKVILIVN